jgi:hypothetical protein
MLPAKMIDCVRETLAANLNPRDGSVIAQLGFIGRRYSLGQSNTGSEILDRADLGSKELGERAAFIWQTIQRCHRAVGAPFDGQLLSDLRQEIAGQINAHRAAIERLIVPKPMPAGLFPQADWQARQTQQQISQLHQTMHSSRNALTERYGSEANIYVLELETAKREARPMTATATITIHGDNHGVVQTGPNSTAHVEINTAAVPGLVKALETLSAAIPQAVELSAQQRRDSQDIIAALIAEAREAKPKPQSIIERAKTLAAIVQAGGTLSHAWAPVKHAIALLFPGTVTL